MNTAPSDAIATLRLSGLDDGFVDRDITKMASLARNVNPARNLNLPPYNPDLNPIEMAFAKLKTLIRKAAARTYDQLWKAVGHVCDIFKDEECYKAAGYETD